MQSVIEVQEVRTREYKQLVEEFCLMVNQEGLNVAPYRGSEPEFFQLLPAEAQPRILSALRNNVEVFRGIIAQGGSLRDDQTLLWRMFQKLKLRPASSLMEEVRSGEVIEVHDDNFIQIFRNLTFFELCSYTLDELLSRPFWELVKRDEAITAKLLDAGQTIYSGRVEGIVPLDIPEHLIVELDSPKRLVIAVQQRLAGPLWNARGDVVACVTLLRGRRVSTVQNRSYQDQPGI